MIPFDKLVLADGNVRRTGAEVGLDELAASIAAHGLLQNLTVRTVPDGDGNPTGQHMVVAGGRRWHALRRLVKGGRLAGTTPIPCAVTGDHSDTEIGLAENLHLPMHPHDQYLAFARLADEGQPSTDIAARFGVGPRVVEQRLRLGRVAPALLALYRDGAMTLDALMAFTVTEDHARQQQAWAELPAWNRSAELIRRRLTAAHVPASDRLARCVGIEAYEAAGGAVLRDLFDDARCWLTDPALLDRLATAEVESHAERLRAEGWRWVRHGLDRPEVAIAGRLYPRQRDPSPEERAEIDRIGTQKAEIEARLEQSDNLDGIEDEALIRESAALDARLTTIGDAVLAYSNEDKARSGCLVWIDFQGGIGVQQGLMTEEQLPSVRPIAGDDERPAEGQPRLQGPADDRTAVDAAENGVKPKPLSPVLVEELTAHRTAGLKLALAGDPEIALAALIHGLAGQYSRPHRAGRVVPRPARHRSSSRPQRTGHRGQPGVSGVRDGAPPLGQHRTRRQHRPVGLDHRSGSPDPARSAGLLRRQHRQRGRPGARPGLAAAGTGRARRPARRSHRPRHVRVVATDAARLPRPGQQGARHRRRRRGGRCREGIRPRQAAQERPGRGCRADPYRGTLAPRPSPHPCHLVRRDRRRGAGGSTRRRMIFAGRPQPGRPALPSPTVVGPYAGGGPFCASPAADYLFDNIDLKEPSPFMAFLLQAINRSQSRCKLVASLLKAFL